MSNRIEISEIKQFLQIEGGMKSFFYYYYTSKNIIPLKASPIRLNAFSVGVCVKGWIRVSIGLYGFTIYPEDLVVFIPQQIFQVHDISDDFEFHTITISGDFMDSLHIDTSLIFNPYLKMKDNPVLRINHQEGMKLMMTFFSNLNTLSGFKELSLYDEIIKHSVYAFLLGIGSIYEVTVEKGNSRTLNDCNNLLERFLILLQKHFKHERSLGFYADKLCVSTKYLSTQIKKTSDKKAGDWIHEIIILEAKVLLRTMGMSVQGVSNELNFPDQSTFGKFFKKHVGMSPKEYTRDYRN